jgi:hypothetical protein
VGFKTFCAKPLAFTGCWPTLIENALTFVIYTKLPEPLTTALKQRRSLLTDPLAMRVIHRQA